MISIAALIAASLLWLRCSAQDTSNGRHIISKRMVESRERCSTDEDCGDAVILACDLETQYCKCREMYTVLSASGGCLPAKQLGEECMEDAQCQLFERNATCEDKFCACDSGFHMLHENNGTLCNPDKNASAAGETTHARVDQNMIIVIAVLAIMFVGICVALHLFSKARSWNRRTIFNTPHSNLRIKLGKRRKSGVRQNLPLPPTGHRGSRHHSFSGQHSPFPVRAVPRARSHECLGSAASRGPTPQFEHRPKIAPLAELESLPSREDFEKKTPEALQNGLPRLLSEEEALPKAPGSPTVIITDADGAHTLVTSPPSPGASSAVNV